MSALAPALRARLAPPRAVRRGTARASRRRAPATRAAAASPGSTLVKVCGVTTPGDCDLAVGAGASFIGMILWPKSKRSVAFDVAAEIAAKAKEGGAIPIGVFVDESAEEIIAACDAVGIDHAQLHGTIANKHIRSPRAQARAQTSELLAPEDLLLTRNPPSSSQNRRRRSRGFEGPPHAHQGHLGRQR